MKSRGGYFSVQDTDFGACYTMYREAEPDTYYHRIANFLFPCYTQVPPGTLAVKRQFRAWVPLDDDHVMYYGAGAPSYATIENDPESQKRSVQRASRRCSRTARAGTSAPAPSRRKRTTT